MKRLTEDERKELDDLLYEAHEQRLALDETLHHIEVLVGEEIDQLDEWVGNGIDADSLLELQTDDGSLCEDCK